MSGRGTRVAIYLPRSTDPAPSHEAQEAEANRARDPAAVPMRDILVIDDEDAVLEVVCRFLEIAGHRVRCATCGREAVAGLQDGRPVDLVVLDLMIPREDGGATVKMLRQSRPGLPVLLCTGLVQNDAAPALLHGEGVYLLRKPFRMDELWDAVNQALAKKTT